MLLSELAFDMVEILIVHEITRRWGINQFFLTGHNDRGCEGIRLGAKAILKSEGFISALDGKCHNEILL